MGEMGLLEPYKLLKNEKNIIPKQNLAWEIPSSREWPRLVIDEFLDEFLGFVFMTFLLVLLMLWSSHAQLILYCLAVFFSVNQNKLMNK